MNEMVERVAMAMHRLDVKDRLTAVEWGNLPNAYEEYARAAVMAMRDPTGPMRIAFQKRLDESHLWLEAWHAAIDAELK